MTGNDPFGSVPDQDAGLLQAVQSALGGCGPGSAVGIAVSGGGDSVALLHLAARVAPHAGWRVEAVTVDHRLRPEAAEEAAMVGRICAALGIPHQVVAWDHGAISGNLMDQARRARYALIAEWARARGIAHVALGHTADDQAETFLMGLARAAGLDGLSGMRRVFRQGSIRFCRPLLDHPRTGLRAYLTRQGIGWAEDPTNDSDRFARTRARRALAALAPLGISVDRLSAVVRNLSMAQGVVAGALARAARETIVEAHGGLSFDRAAFLSLGPEPDRLLLQAMVRWMSGAAHPQRAVRIATLERAIAAGRDATLAGCRFRHGGGQVTMSREPRAAGGPVPVGTCWDHRWIVKGPAGTVRALGTTGLPQVKDWRALGIPREVLLVSPAVWDGDTLLAAPVAGWENGWKARIATPFHRFPVSD